MPINEIDIEPLPSGQIGISLEVMQIGPTGPSGPANTLTIGSVTSGATPSATITGTSPSQTLNLVLPKGDKGETGNQGLKGDTGDAGQDGADALWNYTGTYSGGASYAIGDLAVFNGQLFYRKNSNGGNVGDTPFDGSQFWDLLAAKGEQGETGLQGEQGPAGADALWNFRGEWYFNGTGIWFVGDVVTHNGQLYYCIQEYGGEADFPPDTYPGLWQLIAAKGADGAAGEKGDTGDAATITLGTVSTGTAGSNVSITNTGTTGDAVFNFTIPRGDKGETGSTGPVGPEPSLTITDNANTSITLADSDNNRVIRCTASSAVTITVPSTLAAGFSCMVIQAGTGQVTFAGTGINSFGNLLKTAGQHAPASLIRVGAGVYNLSGNLV
jgi:parallel beta-helix repeat protein